MANKSALDGDRVNSIKNYIVITVLALMVVGFFFTVSNRVKSVEETETKVSPVKALLNENLNTTYPSTPKEVVKKYCEITKCFYGEEYTEAELESLAEMSRILFDDELVANQSDEDYLRALKGEIATYKAQNRSISSFSPGSSADVSYYTYQNYEWAQLVATYTIKTGAKFEFAKQRFLLRKDVMGRWKIYGFRVEKDENENEGAQ